MSENYDEIVEYNREAWNREVEKGNMWTLPVSSETIAAARRGEWSLLLTPTIPVPANWYPQPLAGKDVLCLASGGGQQGPVLAAAGANVTVFDNSPAQLEKDRMVAGRDGLSLRTEQGNMLDLSVFNDESFDLIFHPVSNCFAPAVRPVWQECYRVLRHGGSLLAGFNNPLVYLFDFPALEKGEFVVRHKAPYSDAACLTPEELKDLRDNGEPLEFGHTLWDQIGGQTDAGFLIAGFYEDVEPTDPLSQYIPIFIATRALKP